MQEYPKHYCGVFGVYGHPNAAELSYYGPIIDQDADMMPRVQHGLRSSAKGKLTLSAYQEIRIRHYRQTLAAYVEG